MNVLITGALGHIGSYLIRNLNTEYNLTLLDNMHCQRYCSLFNLKRKYKFIEKCFSEFKFKEGQFDAIVHLAAIVDIYNTKGKKQLTKSINVTKTKQFFNYSKDKIKLLIWPSSTSVYGMSNKIMYEDSELRPQSEYAEAKVEVEKYLEKTNIPCVVFRFGTVFGASPGMNFNTVVNKFCWQAAMGQELTVWKDNFEMYRPYLGLFDLLQAVDLALKGDLQPHQIYNVLSNNYKTSEIVEAIKGRNNVRIKFIDTPLLNQYTYKVDFSKIREYGFKPVENLKDNIKNTIKLIKSA